MSNNEEEEEQRSETLKQSLEQNDEQKQEQGEEEVTAEKTSNTTLDDDTTDTTKTTSTTTTQNPPQIQNNNNNNNNKITQSSNPHKKRRKPNKIMKNNDKWNEYKVWLNELENEINEFTTITTGTKGREKYIIIDGANIGYYQQNYSNAPNHLNYHQIHSLIHYLLSLNYIPILILHCRHVTMTTNKNIPEVGLKFINLWKNLCRFYITPAGYNDDIYWLYATVKLGLHIITNDEMRDHHFQMLQSKYFIRWKDRHQIHFKFGRLMTGNEWKLLTNHQNNIQHSEDNTNNNTNTNNNDNNDNEMMNQRFREVEITFPLKYSHCMQIYYNNLNNGSDDISEDFKGNNVERKGYFIPLKNKNEWLCILPKIE